MTPAARLAAAIGVLDRIATGVPAEKALTNWARSSRYAGSGDRAAVRDLVFDAVRCQSSYAARGGGLDGRALMLGAFRTRGEDPAPLFSGEGHAPAPLTAAESAYLAQVPDLDPLTALDCPAWLAPRLQASLGADFAAVMRALQHRASVFLRVNTRRTDRSQAQAALAAEGILAQPHSLAKTALEVIDGARKIQNSTAFRDGLVELQDAASQAVVEALPLADGDTVLDYCAGGGGKSLAIAARARVSLDAHDASPARMRDLPSRAERAGAAVRVVSEVSPDARYNLVLLDVPCSGSGAWRRSPEGKWSLDEDRLRHLLDLQADILRRAVSFVAPGGTLAYATCSLLDDENTAQVQAFLGENPEWSLVFQRRLTPLDGGDGFYCALLKR